MKKTFSSRGETNILKRKGFYVALGLCLVAIGVAIYIGISATIDELGSDDTLEFENLTSSINSEVDTSSEAAVNRSEADVSKPETSETDTSTEETETSKSDESKENSSKSESSAQATNSTPKFAMPLEGEVINAFSDGELVKSKTLNEWRTHDGVDLKAAADTPVKAIADGVIEDIVEDSLWGVSVTVAHSSGYVSYYNGLKPSVPVKKGAEVKIGDIIGYVGNTAEIEIAEETHLHLAVKKDEEWIDPMGLFS